MLDFFLKTVFLSQLVTSSTNLNLPLKIKPAPVATLATEQIGALPQPDLDVTAAAVMDLDSGEFLWSKNMDQPLPIASLTKIMTAVIVLENTPDLQTWMMIPDEVLDTPGNKIWFYQYEKLKIYDVLAASLIKSGNDATRALAIQTAGSEAEFVKIMNDKARLLNLNDTHFMNPVGFDDDFHFSTVRDLLRLTEYALRNNTFREIVGTSSLGIWSWNGFKRELYTTNKLMTDHGGENVWGVKTGTTENAGQCLISLQRHKDGHEILAVVLNANDRWYQTRQLTNWIWSVIEWN